MTSPADGPGYRGRIDGDLDAIVIHSGSLVTPSDVRQRFT